MRLLRLKYYLLGTALFVVLLLTLQSVLAQRPVDPSRVEAGLKGPLLVWHGWTDSDAEAFDQVLTKFVELNPGVRIITEQVERDSLLLRFQEAASNGFGPDVLIGPNDWVQSLAQSGQIRPLDAPLDEATQAELLGRIVPSGLETVRYGPALYGVPLILRTQALYYNSELVETPAQTLDGLWEEALSGTGIGLNSAFDSAFWGIRAFGGRVSDETGRVILDAGGFANWLSWLKKAQDVPAFVLSTNQELLRSLFISGKLAYLVDDSSALSRLRQEMGPETVQVTTLPTGPTGSGGPFLETEVFYLNAASEQTALSLALAQFLTNVEQQTTLMRLGSLIPANSRVRVNPRLNPAVAAFAAQARSAVPDSPNSALGAVRTAGADTYTKVLEGLLAPGEAALQLTRSANLALGLEETEPLDERCRSVGRIAIWLDDEAVAEPVLSQAAGAFMAECRNVFVEIETVAADELLVRLGSGDTPQLLVVSNPQIPRLVNAELIQPLDRFVPADLLQRFTPVALGAMRLDAMLYGLPYQLKSQALIYRKDQVSVPAQTLDGLLESGQAGRPLALSVDFRDAYWGIPAFGGSLLDESGLAVLDEGAFADWLDWLLASQEWGVFLSSRLDEVRAAFLGGDVLYTIDRPEALPRYIEAFGEAGLGVAPLPDGPGGESVPLVTVAGFVAPAGHSDEELQLALEFAQFVTRAEVQTQLLDAFGLPANANVDVAGRPLLAPFVAPLEQAFVYPNRPEMEKTVEFGGDAYVWVLEGVLMPEEAALEATALINQANGKAAAASRPFRCEQAPGEEEAEVSSIRLWHTWQAEAEQRTLDALLESFLEDCPQIQLTLEALPGEASAGEIAAALASAADENASPHILLAPSRWVGALVDAGLIVEPTAQLPPGVVRRALPVALESVSIDGRLYGVPISVETMALYYNRARVGQPPQTLDELLQQVSAQQRLALLADGYHLYWGLTAFAGPPPGPPEPVDVSWPAEEALRDWLAWVAQARLRSGVLLEEDVDKAVALFANGRLSYLTGPSSYLAQLSEALGPDVLAVAPLPAGPAGPGRPFLESQALYLTGNGFGPLDDPGTALAVSDLLRYLTRSDVQLRMTQATGRLPANRVLENGVPQDLAGFLAQSAQAVAYVPGAGPAPAWVVSDSLYQDLLQGLLRPEEATQRALAGREQPGGN